MSIFDSIKYPISGNLSFMEYFLLPNDIKKKWITLCNQKFKEEDLIDDGVIFFYQYKPAVELLKKVILEWEDDDI